jgi:hypothetical protein
VILLLAVDIVVAWMVIQGAYLYLGMIWQGLAGESLPRGATEAHGRQFLVLRGIQVAAWTATITLFLAWLDRAQQNARVLGASGLGSRGQMVAAFLVPGLNLVRPIPIMRALWLASAPPGTSPRGTMPPWVRWWWALVLAAVVAHLGAAALAAEGWRPLDLGGPMQLLLVAELLEIGAAVLTMLLVRGVTDRQRDAWRALTREPSTSL